MELAPLILIEQREINKSIGGRLKAREAGNEIKLMKLIGLNCAVRCLQQCCEWWKEGWRLSFFSGLGAAAAATLRERERTAADNLLWFMKQQASPPKSINFFHFFLFEKKLRRNLSWLKAGGAARVSCAVPLIGEWMVCFLLACLICGLWALQRQWLRQREQTARERKQLMNEPTKKGNGMKEATWAAVQQIN